MQLSAKARLVSIIVAVVFMFGALAGTGTYLIINHIKNANAITSGNYTSIGNLLNSDGSINSTTVNTLMSKLGNDTTSTRKKSSINGGTPVVFQMGTVPGTSTAIYWQVVYQTADIITVWMTQPYTNAIFNPDSDENGSNLYNNNYSMSILRQNALRIFDDLSAAYPVLNDIVKSPQDAGNVASWQESQANAYTTSTSWWSITNGLGINVNSGGASGTTSDKNDRNPYNWAWYSCMGDKFWIPSSYEVFNTSISSTGSTNGLWGLNATDLSFTTTTLKTGASTSYCWLRSGSL